MRKRGLDFYSESADPQLKTKNLLNGQWLVIITLDMKGLKKQLLLNGKEILVLDRIFWMF